LQDNVKCLSKHKGFAGKRNNSSYHNDSHNKNVHRAYDKKMQSVSFDKRQFPGTWKCPYLKNHHNLLGFFVCFIATRSGITYVMNPWDPITYTVTPAAKILARCVTSGTMTQVNQENYFFLTLIINCPGG